MKIIHFCLHLLNISVLQMITLDKVFSQQEETMTPEMASTSDTTQTLFGKASFRTFGLYVAPEAQLGQVGGQFTGIGSGSVMLLINQRLGVGISTYQNGRDYTPTDISTTKALQLQTRRAGLKVEYTLQPYKLLHLSFPLTIGIGHASVDSLNYTSSDTLYDDHGSYNRKGRSGEFGRGNDTKYGFIQPGINLDVNVFKYGKVFMGASYNIAAGVTNSSTATYNLTPAQLSGVNFHVGMKLGLFNYRLKKA